MKQIKYYLASLVVSVLLLTSCSESFFDINVSPNNPAEATPELVLPSGIAGSAYVLGGYYHSLGSYWTQQYAQSAAASQWAVWESYNLTEDDLDRQFRILYSGALTDYEYVRKKSAATGNWGYYSIATFMQAYTFQVLADLYDKVPFTEALQGVGNLQPHYDAGSLIYDSLLLRIDNALSKDLTLSTVVNPDSADVIFGGSENDWKQFANTLKLKIYLRYVNVDANKYKSQIQSLLSENNFLTKDAKFVSFKAEETGANPFYNTFVDRLAGNVVANTTLMKYLDDNADPRKKSIFTASATGGLYTSIATGASLTTNGKTIKDFATPTIGKLTPVYFFSVEEVLFLKAEAQARYGTAAAAESAFKLGVETSLSNAGFPSDTVIYAYDGLKSIMTQKWVAQANKNGIEAFFDYNRTGYPDFLSTSLISVLAGSDKPKRLFFPSTERKTNANTPAKVALTEKVWWGL